MIIIKHPTRRINPSWPSAFSRTRAPRERRVARASSISPHPSAPQIPIRYSWVSHTADCVSYFHHNSGHVTHNRHAYNSKDQRTAGTNKNPFLLSFNFLLLSFSLSLLFLLSPFFFFSLSPSFFIVSFILSFSPFFFIFSIYVMPISKRLNVLLLLR